MTAHKRLKGLIKGPQLGPNGPSRPLGSLKYFNNGLIIIIP